MKCYGADNGSGSRRNFVDSREFNDEYDGTKKLRIRYNIRGPRGHVQVWVEVSPDMKQGEYVYLICQDYRTQQVFTFFDERGNLDERNRVVKEKRNQWLLEARARAEAMEELEKKPFYERYPAYASESFQYLWKQISP